jgi:uncharacterized protein (TIGR01777 family)
MTGPERAAKPQSRVAVVSGATGLIGSRLVPALAASGFTVRRLVRRQPSNASELRWDPVGETIDRAALEGADLVVNLAGESIDQRWTESAMRRIRDGRVKGTSLLASTLASLSRPPRVLLNAAATGIYGERGDEILDETSSHGSGFLASMCEDWENATTPASAAGIRVVISRNGIVIPRNQGPLAWLFMFFRLGLGGKLGDGRNWMSWISITEIVRAMMFLIGNESARGPVNVVAPNPVTNAEFSRTLAAVLHRPAVLTVPKTALRLAFGQMANETALASHRVRPKRLIDLGFEFQFPTLEAALRQELRA